MKRALLFLGVVIFFSPIWSMPVGFVICSIKPVNYCLGAPFSWMLLWPAYFLGAAVVAAASIIPDKEELRTGISWRARIIPVTILVFFACLFVAYKSIGTRAEQEQKAAVEFTRHNPIVIKSGGFLAGYYPQSYTQPKFGLPSRYVISVDAAKPFSAVIDTHRQWTWGEAKFSLSCVTFISPGDRDASKDDCGR